MRPDIETTNITFVKLVEKNPCIWDSKSETYRNKVLVREAWGKISKVIDEPAVHCPERWRKIRDALFRSLKRHANKKTNRKAKPYYLTPYLQFMLQSPTNSTTDDESLEEDEEHDDQSSKHESKPVPFLDMSKYFQSSELESLPSVSINDNNNKSRIANTTDPEHGDEEEVILNKRRKFYDDEDEDDSDVNFFKSLLRDVRKMNDKQNRKFRLRMMQVIDEILDDAPEENHQLENNVQN